MVARPSSNHPPSNNMTEPEQQKVQEILLILEQLVQREAVTVRFILERLYDIGLINVMNKKVKTHPLGQVIQPLGRVSRRGFRALGTRWFQAQGPKLITNWLYSLVNLEPSKKAEQAVEPDDLELTYPLVLPPAELEREVAQLRSQLRWLTAVMVGGIALLGSSFFWIDYTLKPAATELLEQAQSVDRSVQRQF